MNRIDPFCQRPGRKKKSQAYNRSRYSWPPLTRLYCWRFQHPIAGWCGGTWDDDWSDDIEEIIERMAQCEWPTELIRAVAI